MILGVTGGIAAGKSSIVAVFRELGAEVVSADELAREVVALGGEAREPLLSRFGTGILNPDGSLDRAELGRQVFADAAARGELNRIMHPAIARLAEKRLREAAARSPLVVYEAPLLFEAGAESRVDRVLVVTAPEEVRRKRVMARDGLGSAEARARLEAQMPEAQKVARADYVIDNSGAPEKSREAAERLFRTLMREGRAPGRERNHGRE